MIFNLLHDLRYAVRTLTRTPGFTLIVVLTLAIGVGANVAIFSLAEQILLRPLPVPEPDRLVNLTDPGEKTIGRMDPNLFTQELPSAGGDADTVFSYPMFRDLEREQESFTGLAAYAFYQGSLSTGELTRPATVAFVSGSYFPVLRPSPALGRLLGPEDDRVAGRAESVVLSHDYWQSEFGGDPGVLGQSLTVDQVQLTIVGVAERGFHGTAVSARPSVFVPISISLSSNLPGPMAQAVIPNHNRRDFYWVHLLGRLKPGVTREAAAAAMVPLYRAILNDIEVPLLTGVDERQRDTFRSRSLVLKPGTNGQTWGRILDPARTALKLLMAASVVVLVLCCANVAGLILLRAMSRSGEIAVRASLGATRGRLASLQLAESLVLALPAAAFSLPVAWVVLGGARLVPGIPAAAPDFSFSGAAALVALGVAVASALVVGLLPVRRLIRTRPGNAAQVYGTRHTVTKGVARFRAALATAQVALSMALLVMMGVFVQSLASIGRLDLGVDIESVVMFSVTRPDGLTIITDPTFAPRLTEALEAIPGVTSVTSSWNPLLQPRPFIWNISIEGLEAEPVQVSGDSVSPNFFRMFGTGFLAGRDFDANDTRGLWGAAIVNHRFAERFGLSPDEIIGRNVKMGAGIISPIVGVIGDLRARRVTAEIEPQVYFSGAPPAVFYVRSARPSEEIISAIRATVARVDPTRSISDLQTLAQQFRENIALERFLAGISTAFAVIATALAALGLYGVLAYSVARRSREIALRVALGAPADRIRGMVLRQVTRMAVIGIVSGAAAAWLLGRAAQSVLFGVEAGNPLVLAAAAVFLAAVTLGAAYIPAHRAARIDPMQALREE